jgi:Fic family protein
MIGKNIPQSSGFSAFIPDPFPPPGLYILSPDIVRLDTQASRLIGKLDGITQLLPDVDFFIAMYVRLDATDSSQIEGTRATIIDAIQASGNIESEVLSDVDDILHYIDAMNYGMKRLEEFPLSLRFIREIHEELMK